MTARTLRLLEYDRVREMLRGHAASSLGKELIERMRPAQDALVVRARLQETGEARRALEQLGAAPLGGLHDVRDALKRAEKQGTLNPAELLDVAETAAGCRRLRRYLLRGDGDYPLLRQQGELLGEFTALEQAIDRAISPQGEVLDTASPELERLRRRVRKLHDDIQGALQRTISVPATLSLLQETLITQRNGRFCVPVRAEERSAFKGIVHDVSASGQTVFMEPLAVVELGNDLREAQRHEETEVQRVLAALTTVVGKTAEKMLTGMDAAARLDLIFARAQFANALNASAPEMNAEGIIDLRQARHPLLGETAVPIDVLLGEDGYTTLLITGPNTGGKTVTLKTVGLLTLMAQSGMHIPALPGSRLAITPQIFADIGDEQSIAQSLSTFSGHMTQIVRIIKEAKPRALVLLDEIGAGTDPSEGAALGKAILLELRARECRTIATTHYGDLKVFAQSTEGFLNASVEFDVESLQPTYRLITGLPGSSNALAISQRLGLPKALINQAKELMGESPRALENVLKQAEGVRRALDRERSAAAHARREAEATAASLHGEQRELEDKRTELLAKARAQAQDVLEKARRQSNDLLDELKAVARARKDKPAEQASPAALRRRAHAVLSEVTGAVESLPASPTPTRAPTKPALTKVTAGQEVFVRRVGHRGTALEHGHGDDEVDVQVGIMRVRVPVSDLEARAPVGEPPAPIREAAPPAVEPELLLLGLRAEEAATRLEEYLYDALEAGLSSVRVVHGFGTGALRGVAQRILRQHPAVRASRSAQPHEGGGGVTVAELGQK
ncbi:MAG: endonuclease MutS2 [Armatimonadota bacterium]